MMKPVYVVRNYPREGERCPPNPRDFDNLPEARKEVSRRLGDIADWRRWPGFDTGDDPTVGMVEAYHESDEIGCGGVEIVKIWIKEETE